MNLIFLYLYYIECIMSEENQELVEIIKLFY